MKIWTLDELMDEEIEREEAHGHGDNYDVSRESVNDLRYWALTEYRGLMSDGRKKDWSERDYMRELREFSEGGECPLCLKKRYEAALLRERKPVTVGDLLNKFDGLRLR
jgi:CRISPR/Cas system CMR-associated protein Cmr1 (group 7 of RAMP superfamily)